MASTIEPDMALLSELYETIERSPPGIEARKLLVQHFLSIGWLDAVREATLELSKLVPHDPEVVALASTYTKTTARPTSTPHTLDTIPAHLRLRTARPAPLLRSNVEISKEQAVQEKQLKEGYESLLHRANNLLQETKLLRNFTQQNLDAKTPTAAGSSILDSFRSFFGTSKNKDENVFARFEKHIPDLEGLASGRVNSVVRVKQPASVSSVARSMRAKPVQAINIAFEDLDTMAQWLRSSTRTSPLDDDGVREVLVKRVQNLQALLGDKLKPCASDALMHIEHEVLHRKYIGGESTMLGDDIADISRSNFLCTEDGYAWDMDELSQAIKSNGGIMRNPLSHQLFTTNDIRSIVQHPLGKHLAELEIEQKKLKLGVRPKTIEQLNTLQVVLLTDQSADSIPSRHAVDEFMSYLATLPENEQQAIDKLRVPAIDSHTGQNFDTSIGDNIRDAQGNRVCFHKTGDLIRQAVAHLKK